MDHFMIWSAQFAATRPRIESLGLGLDSGQVRRLDLERRLSRLFGRSRQDVRTPGARPSP